MRLPVDLRTWALLHGVTEGALLELGEILGAGSQPEGEAGASEGRVQSRVRLAAPSFDMKLWRNNVFVLKDDRNVPVRAGLANDTPALNKRLKSGDLIGWRRVTITHAMVGSVIAQFVSLECKHAGWKYSGDEHEQAQQRWAALVALAGGYARFVSDPAAIA